MADETRAQKTTTAPVTADADEDATHTLVLANGTTVATSVPVATHTTGADGKTYAVVRVLEN